MRSFPWRSECPPDTMAGAPCARQLQTRYLTFRGTISSVGAALLVSFN